ncbi:hypothetical protein C8K36_102455 [Rhodococcus sp. OK519]|nr:hypothetical protein C8K36_102455 [Rhodococcus sp. OK519]
MDTMTTTLKTPTEWCTEKSIHILDPDGWRYDNKPWDEPLTEDDFLHRAGMSTSNMAHTLHS